MTPFDQSWRKLTALARQAPDDRDIMLPPGFATRVAARAAVPVSAWAGFERLALRGLLLATVCGAAAIAFNYFGRTADTIEDIALDETVPAVLDLS